MCISVLLAKFWFFFILKNMFLISVNFGCGSSKLL